MVEGWREGQARTVLCTCGHYAAAHHPSFGKLPTCKPGRTRCNCRFYIEGYSVNFAKSYQKAPVAEEGVTPMLLGIKNAQDSHGDRATVIRLLPDECMFPECVEFGDKMISFNGEGLVDWKKNRQTELFCEDHYRTILYTGVHPRAREFEEKFGGYET